MLCGADSPRIASTTSWISWYPPMVGDAIEHGVGHNTRVMLCGAGKNEVGYLPVCRWIAIHIEVAQVNILGHFPFG